MAYLQKDPLAVENIALAGTARGPQEGTVSIGGDLFISGLDQNTYVGRNAGNLLGNDPGLRYNTMVGYQCGNALTSGDANCAVGRDCMVGATTAESNLCVGFNNANILTTGSFNTCIGTSSQCSATGNYNLVVGYEIGNYPTNESSNILIQNLGVTGESNVMRIGTTGSGDKQVNKTFIAAIYGVTTTSATTSAVLVSDGDQLGTIASSIRFKKDVDDMGDNSSAIMQLRPVTFKYKAHTDDVLQYGLIAEEVHEVMPGIVNLDQEGNPFTVRYHDLVPMLLNELQKLSARVAELEAKV